MKEEIKKGVTLELTEPSPTSGDYKVRVGETPELTSRIHIDESKINFCMSAAATLRDLIAEVLKANGVGIEPCEICKWGKTSVERYIENLVTLDMRDFVDFNYCFNCGRKLEAEE